MKSFKKSVLYTLLITSNFQNSWAVDEREEISCGPVWLRNIFIPSTSQEALTIREKAQSLIDSEIFSSCEDSSKPEIKTKTTLNKILNAHDKLSALVSDATTLNGCLNNQTAFPKAIFNALQEKERSVRIMIHLIWSAFMIDNDTDRNVNLYMSPRTPPFLFKGQGFEGFRKNSYAALSYSFPDDGDSKTHVSQVRYLAQILKIDLDAEIFLPFDPRTVTCETTIGFLGATPPHNPPASCILNALTITRSADDLSEHNAEDFDSKSAEETDHRSVSSTASHSLDLEELKRAKDLLKFNLLREKFKTDPSSSTSKDYTTKIIIRMQGAQTSATSSVGQVELTEEMLQHHSYAAIPWGSHLKPTTVSIHMQSAKVLQEYWHRTEGILREAERIIESDPAVAGRAKIAESKQYEIYDRTHHLISYTLDCIKNYKNQHSHIEWSNFINSMLRDLETQADGQTFYIGDVKEVKELLLAGLLPKRTYPLGKHSAEFALDALEAITTEFEQVKNKSLL